MAEVEADQPGGGGAPGQQGIRLITTKGLGFLIVAVLLYLLGRLTQVGWLYLIDAILWGMLLLSAVLPWLSVAFLSAVRKVEYPGSAKGLNGPAEGEPTRIDLTLHNRTILPRFFLSAYYDCPLADPEQRQPRFFVAKLAGLARFPVSTTVTAYRRGMYQLGPVVIESTAPFGLFRRRKTCDQSQAVLVYPQVHHLGRMRLVDGLLGHSANPRRTRSGMEIVGSRPYFTGDSVRHIHWRNTARSGRPMVKEFEETQDQTLSLIFDATQVWGEGKELTKEATKETTKETTLEYAIKIVVSVADYARRNRLSARVWGGNLRGDTIDSMNGGGGTPWPQLLKRLALVAAGEGSSLADSLRQIPPGSSAVVVVSAEDRLGLRAVETCAPRLQQLLVVLLEDFGEVVASQPQIHVAEFPNVGLTRCRPGGLLEALQALEGLGERFQHFGPKVNAMVA